jgi:hypothetical protein
MFADIHHLHQFMSLEQGGSVTAISTASGTAAGVSDTYFGELQEYFSSIALHCHTAYTQFSISTDSIHNFSTCSMQVLSTSMPMMPARLGCLTTRSPTCLPE